MKPRTANLEDAMNRVTAGDLRAFENGEMQFNEVISFLADMVIIGRDRPKWQSTYNNNEPYATAIARLIQDGHIDATGNILKWFAREVANAS